MQDPLACLSCLSAQPHARPLLSPGCLRLQSLQFLFPVTTIAPCEEVILLQLLLLLSLLLPCLLLKLLLAGWVSPKVQLLRAASRHPAEHRVGSGHLLAPGFPISHLRCSSPKYTERHLQTLHESARVGGWGRGEELEGKSSNVRGLGRGHWGDTRNRL